MEQWVKGPRDRGGARAMTRRPRLTTTATQPPCQACSAEETTKTPLGAAANTRQCGETSRHPGGKPGPSHSPGGASPPALEVGILEGQRVGQQQVCQCPPGPRPAEAGPGAGVPHTRFLQCCKRGTACPPTPPASPLRGAAGYAAGAPLSVTWSTDHSPPPPALVRPLP